MTVPEDHGRAPGVGEVYRRLSELVRDFRAVVEKLDTQYMTKEYFKAAQGELAQRLKNLDEAIGRLGEDMDDYAKKQEVADLRKQVEELEDDKKFMFRLIIGTIVAAVLGLLYTSSRIKGLSP